MRGKNVGRVSPAGVTRRTRAELSGYAALTRPTRLFRKGETEVHEAIREALVNALIHADYNARAG
jgi:hypothetical protein